ncbi:E3 ubiquitin-protein ligase TRIM39-like [Cottoperca gobio]|uniref:E3 ubiquitin-protein ligase TRIM39-like n=1 Tax=Cottoperca gobio TaxID=56716 RepID=A0A6J2RII3_COTGO|nr:E3 ubiquitin-protein ligase TRIM39-like [Cottoperca gobio]
MALSVSLEEQFKCCICLDSYTKPTSIPCGHNFCLDCIENFWDTKDHFECPLCKETYSERPQLRINRAYADIIDFYRRSQEEDVDPVVSPGSRRQSLNTEEVPCDICQGDKSTSVKSCHTCQVSYCELHLTPHQRDPALQRHRLKDPSIFTSSHLCRDHNQLLTKFCTKDQMPVCEQCIEKDHKHHNTVCMDKERKRVKTCLKDTKASIKQMIHARLIKMKEIQHSVDLSKKTTDKEIQSSVQFCSMLITAIERHQVELVEELEEKQQEAERRAYDMFEDLAREVNELQAKGRELLSLVHTQNPLYLLQSFPSVSRLPSTRDWSEVTIYSDNCMSTVTRAVSKLVDVCQELANKFTSDETDKMNQYAVNITLDPETACGWLVLSPDRKKVSVSSQKKSAALPDNPQRFNSCVCVLGKQSFTSGRGYWVVQVGDKTDWDLGVARESINRKGAITVRPDSGFWAICKRKGGSLIACAKPSITLNLKESPLNVGVFLDYEEGSVSFFDADAKTHIYTYGGCDFTEALYPYFNPCVQDNGKNTAPLIICPVEGRVREGRDITIESAV